MKKLFLAFIVVLSGLMSVSCEKELKVQRTEFDYDKYASMIDGDFRSFAKEHEVYTNIFYPDQGVFGFNAYYELEDRQIPVSVVASADPYGKIEMIYMQAESPADDKALWNHFISETDGHGTFFGTKYTAEKTSGLFQSVDETIKYVDEKGIDKLLLCAIFNKVPGKVYFVSMFENNRFMALLSRSYLKLDYNVARKWIGSDYDALALKYYLQGNKLSAWGSNYIYFDYVQDMAGNVFHLDVNTDQECKKVLSLKASLDYEYYTDDIKELDVWKAYARGDKDLGLGEFVSAYKASWGSNVGAFDSQEEVIAYVEKNGRPGGFDPDIVVTYQKEGMTTTVTLKSLYMYVEVSPTVAAQ